MPDRPRRAPSGSTPSRQAGPPHAVLQHGALAALPPEVISAKNRLRDRLVPPVAGQVREALALRRARRYEPDPGLNLVGVGIGEKVTSGARTGVLCVKVLVARKFARSRIDRGDRIPASVDGIPTDVEAVGYPRKFALDNQQRHRPVPGGVSGSPSLEAAGYRFAGTLGVVLSAADGGRVILSNNHVLADENRLPVGAAIVQPATLDGGTGADRIGTLAEFAPIKFGNLRNWMDAAVAKVDARVGVSATVLGIGPVRGAGDPSLNLLVRKAGRTTGLTEGVVRVVRFDVFDVQYEQGMVRVDDVMVIENAAAPFSRPGDSGSAIVDMRGRVVGLLFAGSDVVTFAIPIRRILRRFKLKFGGS
jgi:S1-C subfamily serine protease